MTETPPREWFEEHFVYDGRIKFCKDCRAIPAVPMGPVHACYGMSGAEANLLGLGGEWAEEEYDWSRVELVEHPDRPGDWMGYHREAA